MKFTFKVDGIGRGSINQVSLGQGLGQQCAYIFKPFKRGRTFHFFWGRTVVDLGGNYILEPICCNTLALSVCCGPFSSVAFDATSLDTTHKNSA